MRGWESGPWMIQDPELEEGEACYHTEDASIDPNVDLSYIGDKVQSILGHLQKDFEGGVSAENLGAKFGGYGSFLPTHEHSPSVWSQPKSSPRVQKPSTPVSPNNLHSEGDRNNFGVLSNAVSSHRNGAVASPVVHPSQTLRASSGDASTRQDALSLSDQVAEPRHIKHELLPSKSENKSDQRPLRVRIKVGPDRKMQNNLELYAGLGLESPSPAARNSPEESGGSPHEPQELLDESSFRILQLMTSFPVSGGLLLSPLHEDFLNLIRERKSSVDGEAAATLKVRHSHSAISVDDPNSRLGNGGVFWWRKIKSVEKSKDVCGMDIKEDKETSGMETLECRLQSSNDLNCKPLSDSVCSAGESSKGVVRASEIRDLENDILVRKREGNKDGMKGRVRSTDLVKEDSVEPISGQSGGKCDNRELNRSSTQKVGKHRVRSYPKDASADHWESVRSRSRSRSKEIPASSKADFDISEGERVSKGAMDCLNHKHDPKVSSGEQDELRTSHDVTKLQLEVKKRSKESQSRAKLDSNLAEESFRAGVSASTKDKLSVKKDVRSVRDNHKDVVATRSEHVDNLKQSLERPSGDRSKKSNLKTVKEKHVSADKSKERATNKKVINQGTSGMYLKEPPADVLPPTKGLTSETGETTAAPAVLIEENWVGCDRCQQWRLLPYGTKPEQLPDKWVCSMLNWLPGLNHCGISEDETTRALHALYQIPLPKNQTKLQIHADRAAYGVTSGGVQHFSQNNQNFISDQMVDGGKKKRKSKETASVGGASDPIRSSNFNKNLQLRQVKNRSLKEVNQPLAAAKLIRKSNVQHQSKSTVAIGKSSKKQKDDELLAGDDANPRMKSKRESGQHARAKLKKVKPDDARNLNNFRTSVEDLGKVGYSSSSGLPNTVASKDKRKQSVFKDAISGGRENLQISGKKQKGHTQLLPDNGSLDTSTSNKRENSSRKRKLKDSQDSQNYLETFQSNGSDLQGSKVSVKNESSDSGFHREKKPRVSETEEEEFSKNKGNDITKRKVTATRILLSANKENPIDGSIEKEQQVRKYRAQIPLQLTMDDIESLRKDLGSEPLPMAATSSSSKVSDSRKTRGNCKEVKGSPEESVSSSPMQMSHANKVVPKGKETISKLDSRFSDFPTMESPRKFLEGNGNSESNCLGTSRKRRATSAHLPESFEHSVLDFRDSDSRDKFGGKHKSGINPPSEYGKRSFLGNDGDMLGQHSPCPTSTRVSDHSHSKERMNKNRFNTLLPLQNSRRGFSLLPMDKDSIYFKNMAERASAPQIDQEVLDPTKNLTEDTDVEHNYQGDKEDNLPCSSKSVLESLKGTSTDLRLANASVVDDLSKGSKESSNARHQQGNNFGGHKVEDGAVAQNLDAANVVNMDSSSLTASLVLKEAEDLRVYADRFKGSGFLFESNEAYFEASLKFLHGASLLEGCNGETSKHGEMNQMQMYSSAAKLCETCAHEYEKRQEMAAAALAYKCVEVAYMRVVYCKNSSAYRSWHDLQASLPTALQGESPSSSASDIDNMNNLMPDKTALPKGYGAQAGNHVIVPRNRPNFVRLLDFTKDVNSAMEASTKSQNAFAAANVTLEVAQNKEAIDSVKRVIDLSFQNVEELVCLVRTAHKAINRQGFNGNRE